MTTRKASFRRFAASVGIALITLTHTTASPAAGAIPTPGNVRFVDHGGPVLHTAQVNLLFWGSIWIASGTSHPTPDQITAALRTLTAAPYLTGLAQYRNITPAVLRGSTVITSSDPPPAFTDEQVGDFLNRQIDAGVLPNPDPDKQTLYIVVLPASAYAAGGSHFVGEHSYFTRHGQRIPYAWTDDTASLFTATKIISHELVESITDPEGSAVLGVAGACRQGGWCEIADICPDPVIVDGVAAAPYWSNLAGACVAPDRASASTAPDAYASRGTSRSSWLSQAGPSPVDPVAGGATVRSDHRMPRSVGPRSWGVAAPQHQASTCRSARRVPRRTIAAACGVNVRGCR
jgi:hypothetical protein